MRRRRDVRGPVVMYTLLAIGLFGLVLALPWFEHETGINNPTTTTDKPSPVADVDFRAGVAALQAGDNALAVKSFERFGTKSPHVPEVQVNLGFAYFGLGQLSEAEESFLLAIQLRPAQANAYYGLGLVYESLGDLEQARGAMRTFIHLADESEPFLRKARAALWEWESPATEPQGNTVEE